MDQTVFKSAPPVRPLGVAVLGAAASAGATTLTLTAGGATTLGTDYPFRATLFVGEPPDVNETVVVTGATGDVVALESALVGNWSNGGPVWRLVVTEDLSDLQDAINAVEAAMDSGVMTSLDVAEDGAVGGDLDVTGAVTATGLVCPTDADTSLSWMEKLLYFFVDGAARVFFGANGIAAIRYGAQAGMLAYRANGTEAVPEATASGDILLDMMTQGHNGTFFGTAAGFRVKQDGVLSGLNVPGMITLVARSSAGVSQEVVSARASGAFDVNFALAHKGTTAGFFSTTPVTKPAITGWSAKSDAQKVEAVKDALVALGLIAVS